MSPDRTFPNAPDRVRDARAFVAETLRGVDPEVLEATVLMVSELATNAVIHTEGPFGIGIERAGGEARVSVTDHGPGTPRLRHAAAADTDGRGLGIVAAFANAWGVDQGPDSKTVWFTVPTERVEADPGVGDDEAASH